MFALAILFGIYSYLIFILGILGFLYKPVIFFTTVIFVIALLRYFKPNISYYTSNIKLNLDRFSKLIVSLIILQAAVNLIGALGPELSFDALWYHLTIPKIFLKEERIFHIPGGLFYYSDMPKLGESFYIGALSLGNEVLAKIIHFLFGILSVVAIYKVANKFIDKKLSLLSSLIFYSSLVVGWESTTAYVDLFRTFFEIMALWGLLEWVETKDRKMFYESAVMLGLAISTKLIALGSLLIFAVLIYFVLKKRQISFRGIITSILVYWLVAIFVAIPWFVFSFLNTGNPIYPLFTQYYQTTLSLALFNPLNILSSLLGVFIKAADPISPIYLILLPLVFVYFKPSEAKTKLLFVYSLVGLIVWYITPQTGGGRFILPYLPVFSVLAAYLIYQHRKLTGFFIGIVLFISISSIGYRFVANSRFLPVILGLESREKFMAKNLNFSYGDFYDVDGFFKNNIKQSDRVLLYGFHNLYYANFPFVDSSYVKSGDSFNYIATQNSEIPERFSYWNLIYSNEITHVNVYSLGGGMWHY